jgi:UDP-N-acetylmuramate dehydrogenase
MLEFSYRRLNVAGAVGGDQPIILEGCFGLRRGDRARLRSEARSILALRKKREPAGCPSAGCFFRNPSPENPAGRLIDRAGLKGRRIGGAMISPKHANYLVNDGNATAEDLLSLMSLVRDTVKNKFEVELKPEIKVVGF